MQKTVGVFDGHVGGAYPCSCSIFDSQGNEIRFNHRDLSDLEHMVLEMKKHAKNELPDKYKGEI